MTASCMLFACRLHATVLAALTAAQCPPTELHWSLQLRLGASRFLESFISVSAQHPMELGPLAYNNGLM